MSENIELSPEQSNFLTQHGYIHLSEWRLFGQNSSRVLNPTGDGSCPMKWFYVGSPPYTLHPSNNNPIEKKWRKEKPYQTLSTFKPKGKTHFERLGHLARATGGCTGQEASDYLDKELMKRRLGTYDPAHFCQSWAKCCEENLALKPKAKQTDAKQLLESFLKSSRN
jgi:hypothetical protein